MTLPLYRYVASVNSSIGLTVTTTEETCYSTIKTFCYRKKACLGLFNDKTCVRDFLFGNPLNMDTPIIRTFLACPLGVRINGVPLCLVFNIFFVVFFFYITSTSLSFVLATEDRCWSSKTCFVNLNLRVFISKLFLVCYYFAKSQIKNQTFAKAFTFTCVINPIESIFAFAFVRPLSVLAALRGIRTLKRPFQALIDV